MKGLSGAFLRYRIMAWVTGVVLAALTVWLVVGYGFLDYANTESKPGLYSLLWMLHGWLYVVYLYANFRLWVQLRWGIGKFLIIAAGGIVPFLSFVTERYYSKVATGWSDRKDAE